jgi:hypothetical protein
VFFMKSYLSRKVHKALFPMSFVNFSFSLFLQSSFSLVLSSMCPIFECKGGGRGNVCGTVPHLVCFRVSIPGPSSRQRVAIPTELFRPTSERRNVQYY